MNVRTIFLMSMMVCAAPVVCAVPEVSLTEQAKEILMTGMRKSFKIFPLKSQELEKQLIFYKKNTFELMLSKMRIGQPVFECKSYFNQKIIAFGEQNEMQEMGNYLRSRNEDERSAFLGIMPMFGNYFGFVERSLFSESLITKKDVAIVEKTIKDLSLNLNLMMPQQSVIQLSNLVEQVQKILLECMSELNKILRPEAQQLIKKSISFKKKWEEYKLSEMQQYKKGTCLEFPGTSDMVKNWEEIEAHKKKLLLNIDEQNVMSAIYNCKIHYIVLALDPHHHKRDEIILYLEPMMNDVTQEDITEQKKIIKQLSLVLKSL